jgi:hypothetical protein
MVYICEATYHIKVHKTKLKHGKRTQKRAGFKHFQRTVHRTIAQSGYWYSYVTLHLVFHEIIETRLFCLSKMTAHLWFHLRTLIHLQLVLIRKC